MNLLYPRLLILVCSKQDCFPYMLLMRLEMCAVIRTLIKAPKKIKKKYLTKSHKSSVLSSGFQQDKPLCRSLNTQCPPTALTCIFLPTHLIIRTPATLSGKQLRIVYKPGDVCTICSISITLLVSCHFISCHDPTKAKRKKKVHQPATTQ